MDGNMDKSKKKDYTILVVDDAKSNHLFIEEVLKGLNFNYKAIHAYNGKEAVDIFHHKQKVDLVLMDIRMPLMNGIDATKEIRKMQVEVPIIVLTAYVENYDKEEAFAAGCNNYISKPININSLISIIQFYRNKKTLEQLKE